MSLADRVASFLAGTGRPLTAREIASQLHVRHIDVLRTLTSDPRFQRLVPTPGRSPRAKGYTLANGNGERSGAVVTRVPNRAALMLEALRDGDWHSRHDIFYRAGRFFLTNNAAAELRARGFEVEHRRHQGNDEYRLNTAGAAVGKLAVSGSAVFSSPVNPSEPRPQHMARWS